MKLINKIKVWGGAAAVLLTINSCNDYLDINKSPNNLPESAVENVLPGAEIGIGFNLGNTVQIVSSLWMQHMAGTGTQTQPFDIYNVTPNDFLNDWNSMYSTVLDDLSYVAEKGKAEGNNVHAGMAKILYVYAFTVVTDMWGDVPYSDALKSDEFLKPRYDSQEAIYAALIAKLTEAQADLTGTNILANGNGDLIYSGNTDKWDRLANTLKLKLHLQLRKQDEAGSKAAIDELITLDRFIASNADNFKVNFLSTTGAQNPIYQYTHLTRQNDMILSKRFYDSLSAQNDPRIPYYFTSISGGTYPTYDNGQNQGTAYPGAGTPASVANRSRYGAYVIGNGALQANGTITGGGAAPIRLVTKSMVSFWLAEAALTLGTAGDAEALFEQAMNDQFADIETFALAPAGFGTAYIAARKAEFGAATDDEESAKGKLHVLIREKWASSVGIAYESYNDYRRTGFPLLNIAQNNQPNVDIIPYRLPYVQAEIQSNAENVPLQVYPDGLLVKVWWMGN